MLRRAACTAIPMAMPWKKLLNLTWNITLRNVLTHIACRAKDACDTYQLNSVLCRRFRSNSNLRAIFFTRRFVFFLFFKLTHARAVLTPDGTRVQILHFLFFKSVANTVFEFSLIFKPHSFSHRNSNGLNWPLSNRNYMVVLNTINSIKTRRTFRWLHSHFSSSTYHLWEF